MASRRAVVSENASLIHCHFSS